MLDLNKQLVINDLTKQWLICPEWDFWLNQSLTLAIGRVNATKDGLGLLEYARIAIEEYDTQYHSYSTVGHSTYQRT